MTRDSAPSPWIADLASAEVQQRFVVDATPDEYLLPEEMLDMACQHAQRELDSNGDALSNGPRQALEELVDAIKQSGNFLDKYNRSNIGELIHTDVRWAKIRAAAQRVTAAYD